MGHHLLYGYFAGVAELADALDLGSSAARRGSSNLFARTILFNLLILDNKVYIYKREWLSGRASPCQGECRGFESRLPLHIRRHSQVVRQRTANPLSPVRIWVPPPTSRSGGTGRRTGLKILRF